jgi:hypothetical protein
VPHGGVTVPRRSRAWIVAIGLIGSQSTGCAAVLGGTVDYVFSVAGTVTDAHGSALEGVAVSLETGRGVYQGTDEVRRQSRATGPGGGFVFQFISHVRGAPWVLRFEKPGFRPQAIQGASPPAAELTITLLPEGTD